MFCFHQISWFVSTANLSLSVFSFLLLGFGEGLVLEEVYDCKTILFGLGMLD